MAGSPGQHSASSPEEYWRIAVYVPFLDSLISQLTSQFSAQTQVAVKALLLLPANLHKLTEEDVLDIQTAYESDLPDPSNLGAEVELWRKRWENFSVEKQLTGIKETLVATNERLFLNISRVLHLVLVIPVTSANVERANSALKYVKTDLRSTMSEARLNALVLLFIHKAIPINLDAVVDRFARSHPHRMLLINPTLEESSDNVPDV